jgi:hypothetical protein
MITREELYTKYGYILKCSFECDDGWLSLIDDCLDKIAKTKQPKHFNVIQIKEKFGSLRVYTNYSTDEIDKIISDVEDVSYRICEMCSETKTVKMRNRGYQLKTLCSFCANELGFKKQEEKNENN